VSTPTSRVLALLELLQSGGTRTVAELADRLRVDERTVRRYVGHLLDLDVPVESVRGRYGGYRLAPGHRMPPLMLGDDEALAMTLGLRSDLPAAMGTAGETAAAKIRRILPARLKDRLDAVTESVAVTAARQPPPPGPDGAILLPLADAVRHHRPVALRYTDRTGERTDRVLHPHGIVVNAGRCYVAGVDPAAGERRTFRLDRVAHARTLPGSFTPPAEAEPVREVVERFATAAYRHRVTLRIQATEAEIRARLPASVAVLEPLAAAPGWWRVEIHAEHLDWIPGVLATLDHPFAIDGRAELRDLVLAVAHRLTTSAHR
jgi:predicted DNA-binding transcriptional regulator YafY